MCDQQSSARFDRTSLRLIKRRREQTAAARPRLYGPAEVPRLRVRGQAEALPGLRVVMTEEEEAAKRFRAEAAVALASAPSGTLEDARSTELVWVATLALRRFKGDTDTQLLAISLLLRAMRSRHDSGFARTIVDSGGLELSIRVLEGEAGHDVQFAAWAVLKAANNGILREHLVASGVYGAAVRCQEAVLAAAAALVMELCPFFRGSAVSSGIVEWAVRHLIHLQQRRAEFADDLRSVLKDLVSSDQAGCGANNTRAFGRGVAAVCTVLRAADDAPSTAPLTAEAAEAACEVLSLLLDAARGGAAADSSLADILSAVSAAHAQHSGVQLRVMEVLGLLFGSASVSAFRPGAISGAVDLCLRALRNFPREKSVQRVGLRALSRLMSSEEAQRRSGSAKGAQGSSTRLISAAAAALEACRDSAGVAQWGAALVATVALSLDPRESVEVPGSLGASLIRALSNFPSCPEVCEEASAALAALSRAGISVSAEAIQNLAGTWGRDRAQSPEPGCATGSETGAAGAEAAGPPSPPSKGSPGTSRPRARRSTSLPSHTAGLGAQWAAEIEQAEAAARESPIPPSEASTSEFLGSAGAAASAELGLLGSPTSPLLAAIPPPGKPSIENPRSRGRAGSCCALGSAEGVSATGDGVRLTAAAGAPNGGFSDNNHAGAVADAAKGDGRRHTVDSTARESIVPGDCARNFFPGNLGRPIHGVAGPAGAPNAAMHTIGSTERAVHRVGEQQSIFGSNPSDVRLALATRTVASVDTGLRLPNMRASDLFGTAPVPASWCTPARASAAAAGGAIIQEHSSGAKWADSNERDHFFAPAAPEGTLSPRRLPTSLRGASNEHGLQPSFSFELRMDTEDSIRLLEAPANDSRPGSPSQPPPPSRVTAPAAGCSPDVPPVGIPIHRILSAGSMLDHTRRDTRQRSTAAAAAGCGGTPRWLSAGSAASGSQGTSPLAPPSALFPAIGERRNLREPRRGSLVSPLITTASLPSASAEPGTRDLRASCEEWFPVPAGFPGGVLTAPSGAESLGGRASPRAGHAAATQGVRNGAHHTAAPLAAQAMRILPPIQSKRGPESLPSNPKAHGQRASLDLVDEIGQDRLRQPSPPGTLPPSLLGGRRSQGPGRFFEGWW